MRAGMLQLPRAALLVFVCAMPLGEIALWPGMPLLTPTKTAFALLLAAVGVAVARGWRPAIERGRFAALLLLGTTAALAAALAPGRAQALLFARRLIALGVFCQLTVWVVRATRAQRAVLGTVFVTACLLAMLGIVQTVSGRTFFGLGQYEPFGRLIDVACTTSRGPVSVVRNSATFDHPNLFGAFLAGALPAGVAVTAGLDRRPVLRMAAALGVLLMAVSTVFTLSRSAWLAAAVGLGLMAARRRTAPFAVGIPLLGAVLAVLLLPPASRAVLWQRGGTVQAYDAGRLYAWRAAARMIAARPLTGVGPGHFDRVYDDYATDRRDYRQNRRHTMDAHNTVLDVAAEYGLPAAAACVAAAGLALGAAFAARRRMRDGETDAVFAGLVAVLLLALLNSIQYEEILWLLMGLAWAPRPAAPPARS